MDRDGDHDGYCGHDGLDGHCDGHTKKKAPGSELPGAPVIKKAVTYSPALHCSTIGAGRLNFSVRDGKRWDPAAIAT